MSGDLAIVGCGDLGTGLARRLRADGFPGGIVGTTTRTERHAELRAAGVTPSVLTLPDAAGLRALLGSARTLLITLAPRRGASHQSTYVAGVDSAIDACRGTGVEQLVYTSATTVYGQEDGSWVDEESPAEVASERGRALLEAEERLRAGAAGLGVRAAVLRLTGIWGPSRGPGRMLERFAGRERADGDSYLNLVHRDDIIAALRALVLSAYDGLLNLNDDAPTRRRDYYDPLVAAAGLAPIRWVASDPPKYGKRVRNDKIKRVLGLELQHPTHTTGGAQMRS